MNKVTETFAVYFWEATRALDMITDPEKRVSALADIMRALAATGGVEPDFLNEDNKTESPRQEIENKPNPKTQAQIESQKVTDKEAMDIISVPSQAEEKAEQKRLAEAAQTNNTASAAEQKPVQPAAAATTNETEPVKPVPVAQIGDTWDEQAIKLYRQSYNLITWFTTEALQKGYVNQQWLDYYASAATQGSVTHVASVNDVKPREAKIIAVMYHQVYNEWLASQKQQQQPA